MHNTLIVYFSKSGRTKSIAEYIAQELNAQTYEISTEKVYPRNYFMTILESRKEFKHNEKPAISSPKINDFAKFDRIIIGFPIWFFTCPMAVVSFIESYDFSGKTIYPFCTSGSSSCEKASAKIRELCPTAKVHDGIKANKLDKSKLSEWLKN